MTMVLLECNIREVIIWSPFVKMKSDEKNRGAPITGAGIVAKVLTTAGMNAIRA